MSGIPAPYLPYGRHLVDEADIAAVTEVLRGDWLTTGPTIEAFETAFASAVGAPYAISCSSGTAALHLAAMALGLEPGDVVIVPAVTFLATANAPHLTGAEIEFADVDPDTGLMTLGTLRDAVERANARDKGRARAVFPVHLNGQPCDMPALAEYCRNTGLAIVEDACHALGGREVGRCRYSSMATFSLHPVKAIAGGEGGVVTTNDDALAGRLARLRNHGMVHASKDFQHSELAFDRGGLANPWYYEMAQPGLNYRLSDIHAALARSQLDKLDAFVARRQRLAADYNERLKDFADVLRPIGRVGGPAPAWHLYVVLIDFEAVGRSRAQIMRELREAGIGTQVHYQPVHRQPYYRARYGQLDLPGAEAYYARALSLPLYPGMTDGDVERVVAVLGSVLRGDR